MDAFEAAVPAFSDIAPVALVIMALLVTARLLTAPRADGVLRTVLVTGAASGLGRATCLTLAARGDCVVALDVDQRGLASLEAEIRSRAEPDDAAVSFVSFVCDVSRSESVAGAASSLAARSIELDAIVNFAGIIRGGPLMEIAPADVALVMDVNVKGTCIVTRAFFPLLRRTGAGASPKVVIIASELSFAGVSAAMNAPYTMSKFALEAMAVALRQELAMLARPVVRVVVVNPGAMTTPLLTNQFRGGPNAFFWRHAAREEGTLWRRALLQGGEMAQAYMERHGGDPRLVAAKVGEIVHQFAPADRYLVNVSLEMRVAGLLPQRLLDVATRWTMGGTG